MHQFLFQAVLTAAQNGHTSPVKCLQVINNFLFSADWAGSIKVSRNLALSDLYEGSATRLPLYTIMPATSSLTYSFLHVRPFNLEIANGIWRACPPPPPLPICRVTACPS